MVLTAKSEPNVHAFAHGLHRLWTYVTLTNSRRWCKTFRCFAQVAASEQAGELLADVLAPDMLLSAAGCQHCVSSLRLITTHLDELHVGGLVDELADHAAPGVEVPNDVAHVLLRRVHLHLQGRFWALTQLSVMTGCDVTVRIYSEQPAGRRVPICSFDRAPTAERNLLVRSCSTAIDGTGSSLQL